jgi:branched-chain amino acid transport system substrate-binding protein
MPRRPVLVLTVTLIVVLLAVSFGCAPVVPPEPAWEKDANALVGNAEAMFARRQYDQAMKTVEGFLKAYPQSRYGDRALSLAGEIQITYRNYQQALKYYKALIERFPASTLIPEAKYKIGLCYFELKEYSLAADNLEDRTKITDPARLLRISEILSVIYLDKGRTVSAIGELAYLAQNAPNEKQRAGYRDRVRDLVDKKLSEEELSKLAEGKTYPSDLALLRLATLQNAKRQYADAASSAKRFLEVFPGHPERTRAEMLLAEATAGLSAPRFLLGVLVPQTGPASFFGDHALRGIQLAVLNYNTKHPDGRVQLVVKDTAASPETPQERIINQLSELADQGVVAVIGPLLSREVETIAPSLAKLQIPVITPTASGAGLAGLSPWIFRNALTNTEQATAEARYAIDAKVKRIVILAPDDPYGKDLTRTFTRDLGRAVEILATVTYPTDANDFGPYIRKLMEIDFRSRRILIPDDEQERKKLFQDYIPSFDGLYLPGYADKVGLLLPQLAFYNITGKVIIGSNNWHSSDLLERAGQYADGAVFVDGVYPESQDPAIRTVVDAYRSAYQEDLDILAAQAYDATSLVLAQLNDQKDTPAAIRDGLLATKDFPGVSGVTSFLGNGEAQKKLFLIRIENGKFTLLQQ